MESPMEVMLLVTDVHDHCGASVAANPRRRLTVLPLRSKNLELVIANAESSDRVACLDGVRSRTTPSWRTQTDDHAAASSHLTYEAEPAAGDDSDGPRPHSTTSRTGSTQQEMGRALNPSIRLLWRRVRAQRHRVAFGNQYKEAVLGPGKNKSA